MLCITEYHLTTIIPNKVLHYCKYIYSLCPHSSHQLHLIIIISLLVCGHSLLLCIIDYSHQLVLLLSHLNKLLLIIIVLLLVCDHSVLLCIMEYHLTTMIMNKVLHYCKYINSHCPHSSHQLHLIIIILLLVCDHSVLLYVMECYLTTMIMT